MKTENQKFLCTGLCLIGAFALWTLLVCFVDVQAIGPRASSVGFATLNGFVHHLTGVHMELYVITDWLGLVPVGFGAGFAALGLLQWLQRKSLAKVDWNLFVLGGFYLAVLAAYLLFEAVVVNYRPVLIDGVLEASYPSSTTMLVMCVMPTAILQLRGRIQNTAAKNAVTLLLAAFVIFMVLGRLLSGVHWLTDILAGALLSSGLVTTYHALTT